MHKIEQTIQNTLQQKGIKSLLIAVSGGADSVALLVASSRIAHRLNLRIEAVNCNFHLRGEESDRDSAFTASICERIGVPLHRIDYDVEKYMKEHPDVSTEMACRNLRYKDFYRIKDERKLDRIAVAHNTDDDIETMMLNMLRGSGSRGLKGMDMDTGRIIRPLLSVSRKEIEEYLESRGQDYITDSSNLTSAYRRNFIRREILPLLENRWQNARKSLSKTVTILKEENDIIETHYKKQLERLCPDANTLLVYSEGVTTGTILRFIDPFGGNPDMAEKIKGALHNDFKERIWKLSDRYAAALERDRLVIIDMNKEKAEPEFIWTQISISSETMAEIKSNRNHNILYLPSDKDDYIIRSPKTGDRIAPLGMRGTRLVSDIICDAKLDLTSKAQKRVLERIKDGEIIWVTGLKRSRHSLITPSLPQTHKNETHPN